jgi:RNase P subunit RPR2
MSKTSIAPENPELDRLHNRHYNRICCWQLEHPASTRAAWHMEFITKQVRVTCRRCGKQMKVPGGTLGDGEATEEK